MAERVWSFRRGIEKDEKLIVDSWLRSYANSSVAKDIDRAAYYHRQKQVIESLLSRCDVIVAHSPGDIDQVFGWVCFDPRGLEPIVHYVFVKAPMCGFGIGRELMALAVPGWPNAPAWTSHRPTDRRSRSDRKHSFRQAMWDGMRLRFDPSLAWQQENA